MCTHDFYSKSQCYISTYSQSLGFYSHLPDIFQGGVDPYRDYCPLVSETVTISCKDSTQNGNSLTGEAFGSNSACFHSTSTKTVVSSSGLRCYNYKCTGVKGFYSLQGK
jgi:hypothetical protein